jgi:hypothetical protein
MSTACFSGLQTSLTKRWRDREPNRELCPAKTTNGERRTAVSHARFLRRGTEASRFRASRSSNFLLQSQLPHVSVTLSNSKYSPKDFAEVAHNRIDVRYNYAGAYSEKAKPVQSFLELYFDWSGWLIAQQKNELHRTRLGRDDLWVWDFVIDDPFGPVRKVIHDKDMAAFQRRVPDMPPVENELAVNAIRSESGG